MTSPPARLHSSRRAGSPGRVPAVHGLGLSALLLAGLQASGVTSVTEPAPSRDHTERMLATFGARLARTPRGVSIAGREEVVHPDVDGDRTERGEL